jgi:hypothetical protein
MRRLIVSAIIAFALITLSVAPAFASTYLIRPSADKAGRVNWAPNPSGAHYDRVNDTVVQPATPAAGDYLSTSTSGRIDEWYMIDPPALGAGETITSAKAWFYLAGPARYRVQNNGTVVATGSTTSTSYAWRSVAIPSPTWESLRLARLRITSNTYRTIRAYAAYIEITTTATAPSPAACGNGLDDDGDGLVDMNDPGCTSTSDTDETNVVSGPQSTLRPPGSPPLTDAQAAVNVHAAPENRSANTTANHRVPTSSELAAFRSASANQGGIRADLVTGNYVGTTDEIIQWAAWKWGFDEDWVRAQAVNESSWLQSANGDSGLSFGLFQIKRTIWRGSYPLTQASTAFNADLSGAMMRQCMDAHAGRGTNQQVYEGCLGQYFSGSFNGSSTYVEHVRQHYTARDWEKF